MTREDWGTMDWLADDKTHADLGLSLARMTVAPGKTSPSHSHPNCNEVIHVLSGTIRERIDSEWQTASSGETLIIPSGTIHQTECIGQVPAILMIAYSDGMRIYKETDA